MRLVVREHQVEEVCCPACKHIGVGSFPAGVEAPAKYGPNLRALGVYLHEYQLVPLGRVSELISDLYDCQVSEGPGGVGRPGSRAAGTHSGTDCRLAECGPIAARR